MADGVMLVNLASVSIPPHMPKEKQSKTNPSPKPSARTIFLVSNQINLIWKSLRNSKHETLP